MGRCFLLDAETCGHSVGVRRGTWGDVIFWQVLPEAAARELLPAASPSTLVFLQRSLCLSPTCLALWDKLMIVSRGHFQFPRKPTPWPLDACEQRERSRLGSPSVESFIPWQERDGREVAVGIRGQEGGTARRVPCSTHSSPSAAGGPQNPGQLC